MKGMRYNVGIGIFTFLEFEPLYTYEGNGTGRGKNCGKMWEYLVQGNNYENKIDRIRGTLNMSYNGLGWN